REASFKQASAPAAARTAVRAQAEPGDTPVGTVRAWRTSDNLTGEFFFRDYQLRGLGDHIEVWVAVGPATSHGVTASGLDFPPGDCRNDGVRNVITQQQVDYFVNQFETNIYPKESAVFSVPEERNGTNADPRAGDTTGGGDNIVTLVENIRDDNFYDKNNANSLLYILGYFGGNDFNDRNTMVIDGFDWLHRTTANPPHAPTNNPCTSQPARPFLLEATYAHEYQHLLLAYEDQNEIAWVNEGLSDWAQTLTGYTDTTKNATQLGFDRHVNCLQGFLRIATEFNPIPSEACGPENSLTLWGDPGSILADYGATYTFMLFLADRYGTAFMTSLHRDDANSLDGVQNALNRFAPGTSVQDVIHDWAAMLAVDKTLDGMRFLGKRAKRVQSASLHSEVLWDNPFAYDTPGAPPNGSDYVRLRGADGHYLAARDLTSLSFKAPTHLDPDPVQWTVDRNPPQRAGDAALYSGQAININAAIATPVTVPAGSPTLTLDTRYETEKGYDIGYVQVSTDGGRSYTNLTNAHIDPAIGGFTGDSHGWVTETFDLSAYA
ncbi:MAG: immune inhibitor A, partial [Aldersonia sp.]|nr:immune inhibitor A [Aldersonia sp.]